MRHRALVVTLVAVILIIGATYTAVYYEVYPGPKVLTVPLAGNEFGPVSPASIVGVVVSFNSRSANLLRISLTTTDPSDLYLMNATELTQYFQSSTNDTASDLQAILNSNATVVSFSTFKPGGYPLNYLYSTQFSKQHSDSVTVQKATRIYIVGLSLSNATSLDFAAGEIQGYSATV